MSLRITLKRNTTSSRPRRALPWRPTGGGSADGDAEEEEQTAFDVVLTGIGGNKIQVIKEVRSITGMGLKEAKSLVDEAPNPVSEGVSREEADDLKAQIEDAGGEVELQ